MIGGCGYCFRQRKPTSVAFFISTFICVFFSLAFSGFVLSEMHSEHTIAA